MSCSSETFRSGWSTGSATIGRRAIKRFALRTQEGWETKIRLDPQLRNNHPITRFARVRLEFAADRCHLGATPLPLRQQHFVSFFYVVFTCLTYIGSPSDVTTRELSFENCPQKYDRICPELCWIKHISRNICTNSASLGETG